MKKYITVAALLIAGTAFANAAEPVITITDLSKDKTQGQVTWNAESEWLSGTGIFDSESYPTASITANIDLTALGISSESSTFGGGSTELFAYRTATSSTTYSIGLRPISTGLQFTWQGGAYQENFYIPWEKIWNKSYEVGENRYVALTLEAGRSLKLSGGGTAVYDTDGEIFKANNNGDYAFGTLKASTSYAGIFVESTYVTGFAVTQGIASVEEIKNASTSIAIPEPATFGLLAGLGALCLVGTRRFRRNR